MYEHKIYTYVRNKILFFSDRIMIYVGMPAAQCRNSYPPGSGSMLGERAHYQIDEITVKWTMESFSNIFKVFYGRERDVFSTYFGFRKLSILLQILTTKEINQKFFEKGTLWMTTMA